ncbi:2-oxo acid dehydrogenase subunit E2 [Natronobiforma cellulositropha]|uniref:2-oxo acid dehydrogenase subunit E2 n=1 Tax=Natronobiforma cellulositropha TaxID=1679076 RepID=UPI0021D56B4E|nr:2-oxo acid dehydrogenase subunit E2 [Natronobiforma cellulositropha]
MAREFTLPDVGEGVAEGEIVSWLVDEGDPVSEDQSVAEVETDKALVEIPSPVNGTVRELHAEAGAVVPVGTVIVTFDVEGETAETAESDSETARSSEPPGVDEPDAADGASEPDAANETAEAQETPTPTGRVFAPPRVRRLARAEGVDLTALEGNGPGGRLTEADVHAAAADEDESARETDEGAPTQETEEPSVEEPPADTAPGTDEQSPASATGHEPADRERTLAAPATRRLAREAGVDLDAVPTDESHDGEAFVTPEAVRAYAETQQAAQAADAQRVSARAADDARTRERAERIPYRGVRKAIGEQMERSAFTAPHVTHTDEVDVSRLVETRSRLAEHADEQGIRLTYMPFVMKAVVAGLRAYPLLNSQLDEENEEIVQLSQYNLGVAVATDAGLLVPVVEDVDRKGLLQLASELEELVARARDRSISLEEMQGGTFTITNVGALGGRFATPLVNYPEVGILALGAIDERPWVHEGEVVARDVLPLSLSFDHRVLDGAVAAGFTNTVAAHLREPELLLLE